MEEVDHKSNHKCKFCRKMFPCGRSLGGHMRSHLIASNDEPLCTKKKTKKRSQRYSDDSSLDLSSSSEQEEVAFTLILLSMDCTNSDSNNNNRIKSNRNDQSEVNKFRCMICNKAFSSYQALGGHRASHKKFKGCCAPTNLQDCKKSKDHECPICFKIFPSGQALGGHKRSHLINTTDHLRVEETQTPQVRRFLDLNLPAPVEEECNVELKPWWIGAARPNLRLKCV
ncbi:zinc finger protein ZAT4-like [Salvia splendens]|uniref:zinc finger protein ZAT4-like n=1 Tax=Salvia splendens TaxID=180675 RepID=UPI001C26EFA2|nr:zinc finger protein ZAT4-like [Salvia splendens]